MDKKIDPRDDQIAELQLQIEDANKRLAEIPVLKQTIQAKDGDTAVGERRLKEALTQLELERKTVAELQQVTSKSNRSTVPSLPEESVQLAKSVKVPSAHGDVIHAQDGDVLLVGEDKAASALQTKLGSRARVWRVTAETLKEIRGMVGAVRG